MTVDLTDEILQRVTKNCIIVVMHTAYIIIFKCTYCCCHNVIKTTKLENIVKTSDALQPFELVNNKFENNLY